MNSKISEMSSTAPGGVGGRVLAWTVYHREEGGTCLREPCTGEPHPHGNDTKVAAGSSRARQRGKRADVTVRLFFFLTFVFRCRLRQFALISRLGVWLNVVFENSTCVIEYLHVESHKELVEHKNIF